MAKSFNITAQLQVRAPTNLAAVRRSIETSLAGINVKLKFDVPPGLNKDLTQVNATTRDFSRNLLNVARSAGKASVGLALLGKALNDLKNSQGATALNNVVNASNSVGSALKKNTAIVDDFATTVGVTARKFTALALSFGGIVSSINLFRKGIKEALDYQNEFVRLAQVTDKPIAALGDIDKTITNLSSTLGVSSKKLSEVAVTLAQAGFSAKETNEALKVLADTDLAPTFDGIVSSTEGFIAIARQFKLSSDDYRKSFDAINRVAADYAVEADDIIQATKRAGGTFAAAGGNLNQFLGLFTAVRDTTRQSAETIATGLNTIVTRLERPKTIQFLRKLNVELEQGGKFVGPYEAIKRISEALQNLDSRDVRFSQISELLAGYRQLPKIIPLLQNFGTAQAAYNTALNSTGSLIKDQIKAQDSFLRQINAVRESFLALVRELGQNQAIKDLGNIFLTTAKAAIEITRALQPLIPALTAFAAIKTGSFLVSAAKGFAAPTRRAGGGIIPGVGSGDTVPAMLTPGEYVINKKSAQAIGYGNLGLINKYASGGQVPLLNKYTRSNRYFDYGNKERISNNILMGLPFEQADEEYFNRIVPKTELNDKKTERILKTIDITNKDNEHLFDSYGGSGYRKINSLLRTGKLPQGYRGDRDDKEVYKEYATEIQKLLVNSKLPYNLVLYRGLDSKFFDRHPDIDFNSPNSKGKSFKLRGLISTSLSPRTAYNFGSGKIALKILASKGLRGASFYSRSLQAEKEVLLPSGTGFRIIRPLKDGVITTQAFAKGGQVDNVPAMLTPGEFVINKKSAQAIGYHNLDKMNKVQKFAHGGVVKMARGGKAPFTPLPDQLLEGSLGSFGGGIPSNVKALQRQAQSVIKFNNPNLSDFDAYRQAVKSVADLMRKHGNALKVIIDADTGLVVGTKNYVHAQELATKKLNQQAKQRQQASIFGPGNFLGKGGAVARGFGALGNKANAFIGSGAGLVASSLLIGSESPQSQVVQGALGGAAFGSAAGPIGTIGGAVIGGLSTAFDSLRNLKIQDLNRSLEAAASRIDKALSKKTLDGVEQAFIQLDNSVKNVDQLKSVENNPGGLSRFYQGLDILSRYATGIGSFGATSSFNKGRGLGIDDINTLAGGTSIQGQIEKNKENIDRATLPDIVNRTTQALQTQIGLSKTRLSINDVDDKTKERIIGLAQSRARLGNLAEAGSTNTQAELDKLIKELFDPHNTEIAQKELAKKLKDLANTIDAADTNLNKLAQASTNLGSEFANVYNRLNQTNGSFQRALTGQITGNTSRTDILRQGLNAPPDLFGKAVTSISKSVNLPPEISGLAKDVYKVNTQLPDILDKLLKTNTLDINNVDSLAGDVSRALGVQNKDLEISIQKTLEKAIAELGTEAGARESGLEKLRSNPRELFNQIFANIKADDIFKPLINASEALDKKQQDYIQTLNKTIELQGNLNQILSGGDELRFQRAKLVNQFNKGPLSNLNDTRTEDNVRRLAGTTDPTQIANRLISARNKFNATSDVAEQGRLRQEIDNLTKALGELGDVSKRTQTDLEKLGEASAKTEAARGLGRSFFGADLEGRIGQLRQFSLINQAKQRGSLDSFNIEDQQKIVEGLTGPLGTILPNLLDKLIQNTSGPGKIFADAQSKFANEEKAIQERIIQTYDSSIQVNTELARIQTQEIDAVNKVYTLLESKLIPLLSQGGKPFARGGHVRGTDTVPAMLTPGEYVVNRNSASKNMGLLNQINYMAKEGVVGPEARKRQLERQAEIRKEFEAEGFVGAGAAKRIKERREQTHADARQFNLVGPTAAAAIRQRTQETVAEIKDTLPTLGISSLPVRQRKTLTLTPRQQALQKVKEQRETDREQIKQARVQERISNIRPGALAQIKAGNIPTGLQDIAAQAVNPTQKQVPNKANAVVQKPKLGGQFGVGANIVNTTKPGSLGIPDISGFSKIVDNFVGAINKLNGLEINLKVQDIKVDLTGGEIIKGLEAGLKQTVGNAIIDKINTELVGTDGKKVTKFGEA